MPKATYYIRQFPGLQWRWELIAANHVALAVGGNFHTSRDACFKAVERMRKYSQAARIKED